MDDDPSEPDEQIHALIARLADADADDVPHFAAMLANTAAQSRRGEAAKVAALARTITAMAE